MSERLCCPLVGVLLPGSDNLPSILLSPKAKTSASVQCNSNQQVMVKYIYIRVFLLLTTGLKLY